MIEGNKFGAGVGQSQHLVQSQSLSRGANLAKFPSGRTRQSTYSGALRLPSA